MATIAVIVPVYQAEAYLERCVRSILTQTEPSIELILVDDGSKDRSPELCDTYAAEDKRVHVIHQKNSGPSVARNNGIEWALKHCQVSYLAFVDSDDCIHPQYFERLYGAATAADAEIAMCRHLYFRKEEELHPIQKLENPVSGVEKTAEDLVVEESSSFNYCWGKLFASRLFSELRFPADVSFGEDNLTTYKALFAAKRIAFLSEQLYYYFYSPTGITKMAWSPRSLDCIKGIREQMDFYQSNGYRRAFRTEVEAYIQQYAYQIHRIRWDKENLKKNRPYLRDMTAEMKNAMEKYRDLKLKDGGYWFEALHPRRAALRASVRRIRNHLRRGKGKQ